jgi:Domain of unknown function (DUF3883)
LRISGVMRLSTATATILPLVLFVWAIIYRSADRSAYGFYNVVGKCVYKIDISGNTISCETLDVEQMTEEEKFINDLTSKSSDYNHPKHAIDLANLCNTVSRDINTDGQRFIYELLQNADDASNQDNKLDIQIDLLGDYVIISHKGEPFSKIDIESISSAGDGTKTEDSNKTGFKGIGFKSVFAHSNSVTIKSRNFCFSYDKSFWDKDGKGFWKDEWGSQDKWQEERRGKRKDVKVQMPWQIIPIWTGLPDEWSQMPVFKEFNVSTIIKYDNISELKENLDNLLSNTQISLFLRSKEVSIIVNSDEKLTIVKSNNGETTTLTRNGVLQSEWIIKTEKIAIPENIQDRIKADEKSPAKLKNASYTEISFAIQVDKGELKAVDKKNSLIFTYLPTSINYGFPFLVNASFLTDAGRQHLHQDIYWNNWLFEQIPLKFFKWVAELAHGNSKYSNQFLKIVPHKLNGSSGLEQSFNRGYKEALDTIAFIPNQDGSLLNVCQAIFDKTNISNVISKQILVDYINQKTQINFTAQSFMPYLEPISTLKMLGVKIFEINEVEEFLNDNIFIESHKLEENFQLISFFQKQAQYSESDRGNIWNERLKNASFIFDANNKIRSPNDLYFYSVEISEDFISNISTIHNSVVDRVNQSPIIKSWLEQLGVREPSDLSFIEKNIIGQSDTYITKENALQLGRYIFNAHQKGLLRGEHYQGLQKFKVLTKGGDLISAETAYLSDFYKPELSLETVYKNDFYTSEVYFQNKDFKSEWKTFFLKIGVKENIKLQYVRINRKQDLDKIELDYFLEVELEAKKDHRHPTWISSYNYMNIMKIAYSELARESHYFAKLFWKQVFNNISIDSVDKNASMEWGMYGSTESVRNYFYWCLENSDFIPTTQKKCLKASEVFSSNIPNIKEIAGKYLPVFDYDDSIPSDWLNNLNFKRNLELKDYLLILSNISEDTSTNEEEQKANKKRINLIYEKLTEIKLHDSDKETIKDWGKQNKLLSNNGSNFFYPKDLSLVTVEGFNSSNLVYTKNRTDDIIKLLSLFGVIVIDRIIPTTPNAIESKNLKDKLIRISSLTALISVEKSKNRKDWELEYERINNKLENIHVYQASEIYLSYGNEDDRQKRSSWADVKANKFYYTGNWSSPRVLDGMVEPLCKFLGIQDAARLLIVLLLENCADSIEYLKEKSYDTTLIPHDILKDILKAESRLHDFEGDSIQEIRPYNISDEAIGRKGEEFVYKKLKEIYIEKYNSRIIETEAGFKMIVLKETDIGSIEFNTVEIFWLNKGGNTNADHDFKILENGKEIYLDSKATPYNKEKKIPFYVSSNELNLMKRVDKYLIARVFNVETTPVMELIKLNLDDLN